MELKRKLARLSSPVSARSMERPLSSELVTEADEAPIPPQPVVEPLAEELIEPVAEQKAAPVPLLVPEGATQAERLAVLRARLEEMAERAPRATSVLRRPAPPPEPHNLPGVWRDTPVGRLHAVERFMEPNGRHGEVPFARALDARAEDMAKLAMDEELAQVDLSRMLFLDTETTGLAGGTGTLPFLVGLAWFEEGALRLEQLVLVRPGEETPILWRLTERLQAASCIVTYNGKCFDWPLLRTRFILNRVPMPTAPLHLDLLHCTRRVFKHRLPARRLVDVEVEVLGMRRDGDIDGSLIPLIYWDYLRRGEGALLAPIIEHNANDVLALAAMVGVLGQGFRGIEANEDPRDRLGFAEVAAKNRDDERALLFAQAAADGAGEPEHAPAAVQALLLVADMERRRGEHTRAAAALQQALDGCDPSTRLAAVIHLKLAKLYEHRLGQVQLALEHARHTVRAEGKVAHERRLARLAKKMPRAES